jgi:hypothetical protein
VQVHFQQLGCISYDRPTCALCTDGRLSALDPHIIVQKVMTSILAAMQESLLIIESSKTGWKPHESLEETNPQCVRKPY